MKPSAPVRILITGGGTGGHVYPGLAVAEALLALVPQADIRFAGTSKGLEARLIPAAGFKFSTIPASGLRGLGHKARLLFVLNFMAGVFLTTLLLVRWRPAVVLGTGGFVSAPVMTAARLLAIPCAMQEQNAIPGSTNRLVGRWSRRIYLGFGVAAKFFKPGLCRNTGNPVRESFVVATQGEHELPPDLAAFGEAGKRVLVIGGSGGAHTLNQAVQDCAESLAAIAGAAFIVQTGRREFEVIDQSVNLDQVRITAYIDDMAAVLLWADLVVCRAGAMTLAELQVVGRPAVLVPYPYATDDHQLHNALDLENAGAALVLTDDQCDGSSFAKVISELLAAPERLQSMAVNAAKMGEPLAAQNIALDVLEMVGHPLGLRLREQSDASQKTSKTS